MDQIEDFLSFYPHRQSDKVLSCWVALPASRGLFLHVSHLCHHDCLAHFDALYLHVIRHADLSAVMIFVLGLFPRANRPADLLCYCQGVLKVVCCLQERHLGLRMRTGPVLADSHWHLDHSLMQEDHREAVVAEVAYAEQNSRCFV